MNKVKDSFFYMETDHTEAAPAWWMKEQRSLQKLSFIKNLAPNVGLYLCVCQKFHKASIAQVNAGRIKSCGCARIKSREEKLLVHREKQKRHRERHPDDSKIRSKRWREKQKSLVQHSC